jgi:oligopeptide transport system substrate-binding protein
VLRINAGAQPDTIDPQQMSFVGEIGVGQLVWEGLMVLNEKLEPVPGAAEKMDVSADGLKYTLTLRDGLKYSDGTPLTAKNFDYAWHRLFDPRVPNRQYSFVAYDIVGAEELDTASADDTAKVEELMGKLGVKATDDKHIEFTIKKKAAYFPYILSLWTGFPSRQDMVEAGGEKWTTDPTGKYYIGNGPFILKENTETGMTLVGNPNYRLGAPKLKEIRFVYINDTAVAFESYKKGELDSVTVAAEDFATVKADPNLNAQFHQVAGSCNFYLGFNTQKAPFDNVKVRQAFAQALDRQDYVDNVLKGQGTVALSFVPPDRPGYAEDIKLWPFDAAAAKKTLADAGFANGAGLPPIKLTYSSSPRNKTRLEWVQNQIKNNLGVEMQLDPVESTAYTALVKDPATTPQVFFLGWCQDYPDPQDWISLVFNSASTVTHVGWKNQQFDDLTAQADGEQDPAKRLDLYHQAQEILVQEAPAVFIYWDLNPYLIKPYVKGMVEHLSPQDAVVPGFFNIMNIDVAP